VIEGLGLWGLVRLKAMKAFDFEGVHEPVQQINGFNGQVIEF
jgi:hypothetical protein